MFPIMVLAILMPLSGCASAPSGQTNQAESAAQSTPVSDAAASPMDRSAIARVVRADAAQMMADIKKDKSGVQLSSNPFDYVSVSPAFERLVARGAPAVDAIAREIERSKDNGLREYLLAIAGSRILREPRSGATWSTGKGWAAQYRSSH